MKRAFLIALALLATLGFTALGVWQVERRAWKLDLIARVEAGTRAAPVAMPGRAQWPQLNVRSSEYRRIRVTGTFLHDRETLVQALTMHGAGFWVLTPLRAAQGMVLVNRGFVPAERRDPATRAAAQAAGPVTVTGLLRASEPQGGFLRSNDAAGGRWYSRDVPAIAAARGIGPAAPFFIDADATPNPGGWPVGGLTVLRFNNNHLVYALTWFGLAGIGLAALFLLLRRKSA
ncbi:SURF1 family protein [Sphingomonas sp.]|uniref:SURF1 family protein n=1 Tax=Sphingomonas sp. TaxID=28214 RepID=UPI002ED9DFE4